MNGATELRTRVARLKLKKHGLQYMVARVLGTYLNKSVDHRLWEAPTLSKAQLQYAAADAWAHLQLAEAADLPDDYPSGDESSEVDSTDEEMPRLDYASADGVDADPLPGRRRGDATYRHERHAVDPAVLDDEFGSDIESDNDDDVGSQAGSTVGQEGGDGDESDRDALPELTMPGPQSDAQAAAAAELRAARRQIDEYARSNRAVDQQLELSSSFTREQRKLLHAHADRYGLWHGSIGIAGATRRIVIRRWVPIQVVTASIGADAVGSLVARESGTAVVRGRVEGFDAAAITWQLEYSDGSLETVQIDELNLRLARRFRYADAIRSQSPADPRSHKIPVAIRSQAPSDPRRHQHLRRLRRRHSPPRLHRHRRRHRQHHLHPPHPHCPPVSVTASTVSAYPIAAHPIAAAASTVYAVAAAVTAHPVSAVTVTVTDLRSNEIPDVIRSQPPLDPCRHQIPDVIRSQVHRSTTLIFALLISLGTTTVRMG